MGAARRSVGCWRNSADFHGYGRRSDRVRWRAHASRGRGDARSGDRVGRRGQAGRFSQSVRKRGRGCSARGIDFSLRNIYGAEFERISRRARSAHQSHMIIPCIDLMGGKVVQLVQGREKALEGDSPLEMLRKFAAFPEIQVIDLDAAMGRGENAEIVETLVSRAKCRVGGGVRTVERARKLVEQAAHRVIVGTAAFTPALAEIADAIGRERVIVALDSKGGKVVVKGWREATDFTAEEVIRPLEPHCGGF